MRFIPMAQYWVYDSQVPVNRVLDHAYYKPWNNKLFNKTSIFLYY